MTENGFGKRTEITEYPVKGRGTKGVLTMKMTEKKGGLAGALIVREHQELLFITQNGMVQRTTVSDPEDRPRDPGGPGDEHEGGRHISAVALVVEDSDAQVAAELEAEQLEDGPLANGESAGGQRRSTPEPESGPPSRRPSSREDRAAEPETDERLGAARRRRARAVPGSARPQHGRRRRVDWSSAADGRLRTNEPDRGG